MLEQAGGGPGDGGEELKIEPGQAGHPGKGAVCQVREKAHSVCRIARHGAFGSGGRIDMTWNMVRGEGKALGSGIGVVCLTSLWGEGEDVKVHCQLTEKRRQR